MGKAAENKLVLARRILFLLANVFGCKGRQMGIEMRVVPCGHSRIASIHPSLPIPPKPLPVAHLFSFYFVP